MSLCYSNLGDSMRAVEDGYVAQEGEVLFGWYPSEEELRAAFPGRQAAQEAAALAAMGALVRAERDRQLREIYDAGINMALRGVRMSTSPEQLAYAEGKVSELDEFAELLTLVPEQPGFPETIVWPPIPTV